jgi:predicted ChrR family anti-sigma factor
VGRFEAAAAELAAEAPVEAMSDDALAHVLARLEREPRRALAEPDRRPLVERMKVGPKRWMGPGNWVRPVLTPLLPGDRLYLTRAAPGQQGLEHGHKGAEATAILSGALEDRGEIYGAGAFILQTPEVVHQPKVMPDDGGCLCLIATEGQITTRDRLGALIKAWAGV